MFFMKCNIMLFFRFLILFYSFSLLNADPSLVDLSKNLDSPVNSIIYALLLMSFIIGFGFLVGAIFLWRRHRENPVHVPLSQVLFALIIGFIAMFVPYFAAFINGYDFFTADNKQELYLESRLANTHATPSLDPVQPASKDSADTTSKKSTPLWEES